MIKYLDSEKRRALVNPSGANPTKWSNTLKQCVGFCQRIALCAFDHFVGLALKGLRCFSDSQLKYFSIVSMFHNCELNKIINRLHEEALRLTYDDYNATFEEPLQRDRSCTIHENSIQLAIKMFKDKHGLTSDATILHNCTTNLNSVYQKSINIMEKIQ